MQEGHPCSKTLESIVQTHDVAVKIKTRNIGYKKIYYGREEAAKLAHLLECPSLNKIM